MTTELLYDGALVKLLRRSDLGSDWVIVADEQGAEHEVRMRDMVCQP